MLQDDEGTLRHVHRITFRLISAICDSVSSISESSISFPGHVSEILLGVWSVSFASPHVLAVSGYCREGYSAWASCQADFLVGAGTTISLPRFSSALCHSHPHWQRTESHKRGFFRSALHMAHDLIHMAFSPTFYCAD